MYLLIFCVAAALLSAVVLGHGGSMDDDNSEKRTYDDTIPRLLLLSVDGFRYDYIEKMRNRGTPLVNLERLINEGVYAPMKPQFPSETFVNHVTLMTGLFPTSHGVLGNHFYDSQLNVTFDPTHVTSQWYDERLCNVFFSEDGGPEPLWFTNERQRSDIHPFRRSGVHFWPCAYRFRKTHPTAYDSLFDDTIPLRSRIDHVLGWFLGEDHLPKRSGKKASNSKEDIKLSADSNGRPINFAAVYYEQVDEKAHKFGPDSDEVLQAVAQFDNDVGYLLDQVAAMADEIADLSPSADVSKRRVKRHGAASLDWLNIVIVSDHGAATVDSTNPKKTFEMSEVLDVLNPSRSSSSRDHSRKRSRIVLDSYSSFAAFASHYLADLVDSSTGKIYMVTDEELADLNQFHPALRVYRVHSNQDADSRWATVPPELHLSVAATSPVAARLRSMLFLVSPGYLLKNDAIETTYEPQGAHGYNQSEPSMRAIFVARGPAFRRHYRVPATAPFENVDLYALLCTVLKLRAAPSNGSLHDVTELLSDSIRAAIAAPPMVEQPHFAETAMREHGQLLTYITYIVFGVLIVFVSVLLACGAILRRNMRRVTAVRMHPDEIQMDGFDEDSAHIVTVRGKSTRKDAMRMHNRRTAERQKLMDDVDDPDVDLANDEVNT